MIKKVCKKEISVLVVLYNLGDLPIDSSQYKSLARRIEDILTGRKSLFEIDQDIEHHASVQLIQKQPTEGSGKKEVIANLQPWGLGI